MRIPEFRHFLQFSPSDAWETSGTNISLTWEREKPFPTSFFPPFLQQPQVLYACQHLSFLLTCFFSPSWINSSPHFPDRFLDTKQRRLSLGWTRPWPIWDGGASSSLQRVGKKHTWKALIIPKLKIVWVGKGLLGSSHSIPHLPPPGVAPDRPWALPWLLWE